jgi:imidazolonepropionase-like amidohydrolase
MLEHGTVLVPTLTTAASIPKQGSVPDFLYQKKIRWSALAIERVAEAIRRGVPTALGTDSGVTPHGQNLRELAHLVDLGLSPMGAIEAGTRLAARLLGLDKTLGTLEPGKLARPRGVRAHRRGGDRPDERRCGDRRRHGNRQQWG